VATRIKEFCGDDDHVPVIFCGDFNSQPNGYVHRYLTQGKVNAKTAAPWYALSLENSAQHHHQQQQQQEQRKATDEPRIDEAINLEIHKHSLTNDGDMFGGSECPDRTHPEVRYILDYTLNRLCRWLRILGLNAALETEEEEIERTKYGRM
jgi:hypothetical protein